MGVPTDRRTYSCPYVPRQTRERSDRVRMLYVCVCTSLDGWLQRCVSPKEEIVDRGMFGDALFIVIQGAVDVIGEPLQSDMVSKRRKRTMPKRSMSQQGEIDEDGSASSCCDRSGRHLSTQASSSSLRLSGKSKVGAHCAALASTEHWGGLMVPHTPSYQLAASTTQHSTAQHPPVT